MPERAKAVIPRRQGTYRALSSQRFVGNSLHAHRLEQGFRIRSMLPILEERRNRRRNTLLSTSQASSWKLCFAFDTRARHLDA